MADDRRISSLLGGIARAVGPSEQDIRALQRRREQHERRTAKRPAKAFDEMLADDQQARDRDERRRQQVRGQAEEAGKDAEAAPDAPAVRASKPPMLPRGRGRLIRG